MDKMFVILGILNNIPHYYHNMIIINHYQLDLNCVENNQGEDNKVTHFGGKQCKSMPSILPMALYNLVTL